MKLFTIIKTFDKKQWDGYMTYIKLYHSSKSTIYRIVEWLDEKAIWRNPKVIGDDFEKMHSKLPFELHFKSFSNSIAKLSYLAEEYIGWIVWKDSKNLKMSCQLLALAQKSLSDQYLKTQKEVLNESKTKVISIWDEHYKMLSLFNDYYFGISFSENNYTSEFNNLINSFKKSIATTAQLLMVEIISREKLLSESWTHQMGFFNALYEPDTKLKKITDQLILMNRDGSQEAYEYLIVFLMSKESAKFSHHVRYCIVSYCINFLTRIIRKGEVSRGQELLDLYEYSLEKGIYTLNDMMSLKKFINIISVSSKLKKYEWSRKIVDKWAHKVNEYSVRSIAKLGHATIDFQQKKYEDVVNSLSQIKSPSFTHRLRARWLLLIAQYEINNDHLEVVTVQIDNFRRFIISNEYRMNSSTYQSINASVKILNMLIRRKEKNKIENFYKSSKYVFERKWILEKIKNPV